MANAPYPIRGLGDWWNELRLYINDRPTETKIVEDLTDPESDIGEVLDATFATRNEVRSKAKANGTDQTAVIQEELDALHDAGGGTLVLPGGTIRLDGKITLPYTLDETGAPVQRSLAIIGQGRKAHGRGSGVAFTPEGGTVLDMRWSSTTALADGSLPGKFVSLGFGALELAHLTFEDSAGGANPFFRHTNTTVHIHDISGIGTKSGVACDQDLIIAGGKTIPGSGDFALTEDSPFQGYGSVYRNIWHNGIRRALLGGAYFNQVVIDTITGWQRSGNATGGSIEIDPGTGTAQGVYGSSITNVLCESGHYQHTVKVRKFRKGIIANVGSYDYHGSVTYLSALYLDECGGTTIIRGYDDSDGAYPYISSPGGQNWRDYVTLIGDPGTSHENDKPNHVTREHFRKGIRTHGRSNGVAELIFGDFAGAPELWQGNNGPEGVVTAPKGSLYLHRGDSSGRILWVKESGSGNTGWVAYGPSAATGMLARSGGAFTVDPFSFTNQVITVDDATGGPATLPAAAANLTGRSVRIKNLNAAALTVQVAGGGSIDGAATASLVRWETGHFICNGSTWYRLD